MTGFRFLRLALLCGILLGLAACSTTPRYVINKPPSSVVCTDATGVSCEVTIDVQWDGVSVRPHPELALDGVARPVAFATVGNSSVVKITTGLGPHTVLVSGDLAANSTVATYSASSAFTITPKPAPTGGFSVSASQSDVLVERGKSVTTTITVTRVAPFTGAVTLALTTPPTGITAPGATIAAGASSTMFTIATSLASAHGKATLSLVATAAGVPPVSAPLRLLVGREAGAFQEASPSPYQNTVPSSRTALAGNFRVDIAPGGQTLPQPFKASFFRAQQAVGGEIGFTLGPVSNVGGAGFCANTAAAAITRGVVLSGAMPGFAAQNVVTFLDLTGATPQRIEATADMNVQQVSNGPFILFQPRVFFSPDCTVALVAGANKLGPSRHILRLIDLRTGQPIGTGVPFETATFGAQLRNAASRQEIQVSVDTGSASAATAVYTVP